MSSSLSRACNLGATSYLRQLIKGPAYWTPATPQPRQYSIRALVGSLWLVNLQVPTRVRLGSAVEGLLQR